MQTKRQDLFTTIRTEGAILPPDLLLRVADESTDIPGLTPSDYHLSGERINEAVSRSWNRLQGAWAAFRQASQNLPPADAGTSRSRERWLLPLFHELGYGRLQAAKSIEIEGKTYAISHAWHQVPIHLVSFRVDLDKRTAGVTGASRSSPHSVVQELLNRETGYLWGFASNGLRLRILRDNKSLTRQAFVEFDLQAMMDGQVYPDFKLLWLLCHQSRVEGEQPAHCWLEKWSQTAIKQGTRALDSLRDGVQRAIEALGRGFLSHPANRTLRDRLQAGTLDKQDYYRQLLRLIYRLLFLFVAEDRGLLFDPSSDSKARDRYTRFYSTQRLRTLAGKSRGTPHADLYEPLRLIFQKLDQSGCPELGLPALGSFLWSPAAIADLAGAQLTNRDLLDAIRELAYTLDGQARRSVDYRNLGSEELGSIYESLLELHPQINVEASTIELVVVGGHERKTSASYYTHPALVGALLELSLEPALAEVVQGGPTFAVRGSTAEELLLNLKVCDPACGSGHFLVAAAHRIAKRLAAVRSGDEEPAPELYRHALRDVIRRCIYGVDLNPMAVELCKVSLWMESLEPGKPLSFLDNHIQIGNAVLGAMPRLLQEGVPDDAFTAVDGDDSEVCKELRKQNKQERIDFTKGQAYLFDSFVKLGNLPATFAQISAEPEDNINAVASHAQRYEQLVRSTPYENARLLADAWCAAFVAKKDRSQAGMATITERAFRDIERTPAHFPEDSLVRQEILRYRKHYGFFHWHLAFPEVFRLPTKDEQPDNPHAGWCGGFDLMLGNPPWETLSPDAKEFFSTFNPQVRFEDKDGQQRIIHELLAEPVIRGKWEENCRDLYALVHFLKNSGRFRLYAPGNLGKGDFNIFRMFTELSLDHCAPGCRAAQIVPEGLYNGANCMAIRQHLFERFTLTHLLCFENTREVWFKNVHSAAKFCVYAARRQGQTNALLAAFNLRSEAELAEAMAERTLSIPVSLVRELSPEALAIPELSSQLKIDIATKMYARCPKFGDAQAGDPLRHYMREIDMGTDRDLFNDEHAGIPLYEGRMVDQFDYRAKGYRSGRGRSAIWEPLCFGDPTKSVQAQWFISMDKIPAKAGERVGRFRVGFCNITGPANERTLVASLVPTNCICGDSLPNFVYPEPYEWAYMLWLAVANSFSMDYLARQKVSLHLTHTIMDSLPFPRPDSSSVLAAALVPRALLLMCTGPEMTAFWQRMAGDGWVPSLSAPNLTPGAIDEGRRIALMAEIDAIVARYVYGLTRDELAYILDTFPIVRRLDIEKCGRFRTKDEVLAAYDRMVDVTPVDWATVAAPREASAVFAAPAVTTAPREPDSDLIVRAFLDTRNGFSPDYVVACPEANGRFLQRVRQLGVGGADGEINRLLLNARKASKLKGQPSEKEYRLAAEYEPWIFASEWAMRHLQRLLVKETDKLVTLDDILCNPALAARFDEIVARIKPGFATIDYRWAALGMRKKGKSKPAARDLKVSLERQMTLDEVLGGAPHGPGLYLIRAAAGPIYINHTSDLRDQIDRHTSLAGEGLIPDWLTDGFGRPSGVSYAYLAGIQTNKLREVRISGVAEYRPWLNLLDLEGAA